MTSLSYPCGGVFVKDDSGHLYFIPADMYDDFKEWEKTFDWEYEGEDWNGFDFDECRLAMSHNNYVIYGTVEER